MTNYEKIQTKDIKELANFYDEHNVCPNIPDIDCFDYKNCQECLLDWLNREADED